MGRFALANKNVLDSNRVQFVNSGSIKRAIEYIVNRQNEDGGYTFCQEAESNAQDTYYGLAVLRMLNVPFPNVEKTIRWLLELDLDSTYSYYYVAKALTLCGEPLDYRFKEHVFSVINSRKYVGKEDVYAEISSEFELTFMVLELADLLNVKCDGIETEKWIFKFKNVDGGFGARKHSNINSTYYALASLDLLKYNVKKLQDTKIFLRECEKPYGGFTVIPTSVTPYMEHTYYGVTALNLVGESCRFPAQTVDFILRCQNANGGFARSDSGISTLENTFQAVSMLRKLGFL
ncbi:MAG: prenyltransferase/squalene oxidase repeat-containing protein [Candidatus Bathyarchaeia archaeon]